MDVVHVQSIIEQIRKGSVTRQSREITWTLPPYNGRYQGSERELDVTTRGWTLPDRQYQERPGCYHRAMDVTRETNESWTLPPDDGRYQTESVSCVQRVHKCCVRTAMRQAGQEGFHSQASLR